MFEFTTFTLNYAANVKTFYHFRYENIHNISTQSVFYYRVVLTYFKERRINEEWMKGLCLAAVANSSQTVIKKNNNIATIIVRFTP